MKEEKLPKCGMVENETEKRSAQRLENLSLSPESVCLSLGEDNLGAMTETTDKYFVEENVARVFCLEYIAFGLQFR